MFDASTLLVCSEIEIVRFERITARMQKVDENLAKKFKDSYID